MLPRFEQFHLKFSRELATHGSAHLFELTLGDKVLSAAIVYSLGKTWYAYQTGMDPEYWLTSHATRLDAWKSPLLGIGFKHRRIYHPKGSRPFFAYVYTDESETLDERLFTNFSDTSSCHCLSNDLCTKSIDTCFWPKLRKFVRYISTLFGWRSFVSV
jgi:hypothetical protein